MYRLWSRALSRRGESWSEYQRGLGHIKLAIDHHALPFYFFLASYFSLAPGIGDVQGADGAQHLTQVIERSMAY